MAFLERPHTPTESESATAPSLFQAINKDCHSIECSSEYRHTWSHDDTGANGVDADSVSAVPCCVRSRKPQHTCLGNRIQCSCQPVSYRDPERTVMSRT